MPGDIPKGQGREPQADGNDARNSAVVEGGEKGEVAGKKVMRVSIDGWFFGLPGTFCTRVDFSYYCPRGLVVNGNIPLLPGLVVPDRNFTLQKSAFCQDSCCRHFDGCNRPSIQANSLSFIAAFITS